MEIDINTLMKDSLKSFGDLVGKTTILINDYISEIEDLLSRSAEGDIEVESSFYIDEVDFDKMYPHSKYGIMIPIEDAIKYYKDALDRLVTGKTSYDDANY